MYNDYLVGKMFPFFSVDSFNIYPYLLLKEIFFYNTKICNYSNLKETRLDMNCFRPMQVTYNDFILY